MTKKLASCRQSTSRVFVALMMASFCTLAVAKRPSSKPLRLFRGADRISSKRVPSIDGIRHDHLSILLDAVLSDVRGGDQSPGYNNNNYANQASYNSMNFNSEGQINSTGMDQGTSQNAAAELSTTICR